MDATEGFKEALVSAEQRQRRGRPDDERLNLGRRQVESCATGDAGGSSACFQVVAQLALQARKGLL